MQKKISTVTHKNHANLFIFTLTFSHRESPHPAPHRRPSPVGSSAWCAAATGSADSVPRPAGALWPLLKGNRVGHSPARCTKGAAGFCLNPTGLRVASATPELRTSMPGPVDAK